jgi:hypothetical protein
MYYCWLGRFVAGDNFMELGLAWQLFVTNSCKEFHEIPTNHLTSDTERKWLDERMDGLGTYIMRPLFLLCKKTE